jgi:pimeloyl-ACP methyl ester carboxylesterase
VAALLAVADAVHLERFDLLGISLGAPVSVAVASRFPDRVGRLILYGGYLRPMDPGRPFTTRIAAGPPVSRAAR